MIAICIGHSRPGDGGAVSWGGISEHAYNLQLGRMVVAELLQRGLPATLISAYEGGGYGEAMQWLAAEHRRINAQVTVELHFNSADNPAAGGHEWLFWATSLQGRFLAQALERLMASAFPALARRGIKSIRGRTDRGSGYLRLTPCPAVICEPFFGSCPADWQMAVDHQERIAAVIAGGLAEWLGGQAP